MDRPCFERALLLVGAVMGAGFASGREIMSFFSAYGSYSWLMILLAVVVMVLLCCLCFYRTSCMADCQWCTLYMWECPWVKRGAEGCILLLQAVVSGSMISAAGHIAALFVPWRYAYSVCALGTLLLALWLGYGRLRPLTVASSLLAAGFVAVMFALLIFDGDSVDAVPLQPHHSTGSVLWGCLRAVSYAAVNMTLAIGMVCRVASCNGMAFNRTATLFGCLMTALLFGSNLLYVQHPELQQAAFPTVVLLARFGRIGFVTSLCMLYLAVLTTLTASLFTFRTGLEKAISPSGALCLSVLCPAVASLAGFETIVDGWYVPIGMGCLVFVFAPLLFPRHVPLKAKNAS